MKIRDCPMCHRQGTVVGLYFVEKCFFCGGTGYPDYHAWRIATFYEDPNEFDLESHVLHLLDGAITKRWEDKRRIKNYKE